MPVSKVVLFSIKGVQGEEKVVYSNYQVRGGGGDMASHRQGTC